LKAAPLPVVEIADPTVVPFQGYGGVLLTYDELRKVVDDRSCSTWRAALTPSGDLCDLGLAHRPVVRGKRLTARPGLPSASGGSSTRALRVVTSPSTNRQTTLMLTTWPSDRYADNGSDEPGGPPPYDRLRVVDRIRDDRSGNQGRCNGVRGQGRLHSRPHEGGKDSRTEGAAAVHVLPPHRPVDRRRHQTGEGFAEEEIASKTRSVCQLR
jgi:hypothetical protein